MKKSILILLSFLVLIPAMLLLESCNDDEESAPIVLVVAERSSGKLFVVDATTAAKTEAGTITTLAGAGLTNIRGMIFDKATNKIYASSTDDGDGAFYSIDPSTKQATAINADTEDHWYGVADLLMTSDNKIMGSLYFKSASSVGSGPGLITLNSTGTVSNEVLFTNDDIYGGMGITFGNNTTEILIASFSLEIYKSTLTGTVTLINSLIPDGFPLDDPEEYVIQNMVKDSKGIIYAVVYGYDDGNTYLAKVDLANNKLIEIGVLGEGNSNRYHGLVLLSQDLL